ncbi:MAG: hypothetical protein E7488_07640 [Ruminococcaceae bacterium]|nr:hypothetical protein [Oscillospiraceae bacterium]
MFKTLYYVPAIIWTILLLVSGMRVGEFEFLLSFVFWFNLAVMTMAGALMHKSKIIGAYLGIAFGAGWIIYDIAYQFLTGYGRDFPNEIVCIPLIIYYIYCAITIKTSLKK